MQKLTHPLARTHPFPKNKPHLWGPASLRPQHLKQEAGRQVGAHIQATREPEGERQGSPDHRLQSIPRGYAVRAHTHTHTPLPILTHTNTSCISSDNLPRGTGFTLRGRLGGFLMLKISELALPTLGASGTPRPTLDTSEPPPPIPHGVSVCRAHVLSVTRTTHW